MSILGQSPNFSDRVNKSEDGLVSPLTFTGTVGASQTTIFTGKSDRTLLLRKLIVANTTGSAINLGLDIGGDTIISQYAVPANTTTELFMLTGTSPTSGLLLDVSEDIQATGQNLYLRGWGLMILGGRDNWML